MPSATLRVATRRRTSFHSFYSFIHFIRRGASRKTFPNGVWERETRNNQLYFAFAPNGRYLVVTGEAGRLQFWDVATYQTFLYLYSFGAGAWLALLPDGRFDANPEGMRYLCYTEKGTLNSYRAEELVKEFYDPEGVKAVLAKYHEI